MDTAMPMQIDGEGEEEEEEQYDHRARGEQRGGAVAVPSPSSSRVGGKDKAEKEVEEVNRRGRSVPCLDGLCCSICLDPWGSQGDHQVSCLPCGHVYGFSCISKWIQRCNMNLAKCPQCNGKFMLKDIRKLYAPPVIVLDEDLKKRNVSFQAEIDSLKAEKIGLLNLQDNLLKELHRVKERLTHSEKISLGELGSKPLGCVTDKKGPYIGPSSGKQASHHCSFILEKELEVEGARLFDMDISYQMLILARRISGLRGTYMLNKINMLYPQENEDIQLPLSSKVVKDIHVSPCGRNALLASLGRTLSVLSMGSNIIVINCNLPGPAWSCSWDTNSPYRMYAGLQNGMLLVFDMRLTKSPLLSLAGLTSQPIHTIHSLRDDPSLNYGAPKLLTASSTGPCVWNTANAQERPFLVPGSEDQGACISLAYGPSSDDIVASYRPKVQSTPSSTLADGSQPSTPDQPAPHRQGIMASQVHFKRIASNFYHNLGSAPASLCDIQMKKSAVVNVENCPPLFTYGNDLRRGLTLRELPSLNVTQDLNPHQHPILDVKYTYHQGTGLLGCVSDDRLQLFSAKVS